VLAYVYFCVAFAAPWRFPAMVVANRLAWLRKSVSEGCHTRIHIGPAQAPEKCKFRVTLDPNGPPLSAASQKTLLLTLDAVATTCDDFTIVDRGHRHSSGLSEAAFWLSVPRGLDNSQVLGGDSDDNDDQDGGDDTEGDTTDKSTEQDHDPWENGNDPWSTGGTRPTKSPRCPTSNPVSKRPRRRADDVPAALHDQMSCIMQKSCHLENKWNLSCLAWH